jgi:hypothetical protein
MTFVEKLVFCAKYHRGLDLGFWEILDKYYKLIMVCDTPPYGHAPKYQISLTYLERKPSMV